MHTTTQILDAIAEKHGGATDYRLSKLLGTSTSGVANWRNGRTYLSQDFAHRAAALLEWDPAYVVACVEHERAQRLEQTDEIKATWSKIAERFKPAAAVILAVLFLTGALPSQRVTAAELTSSHGPSIHYAKYEWLRRWLRRVAQFWRDAVTSYGFATVFP